MGKFLNVLMYLSLILLAASVGLGLARPTVSVHCPGAVPSLPAEPRRGLEVFATGGASLALSRSSTGGRLA